MTDYPQLAWRRTRQLHNTATGEASHGDCNPYSNKTTAVLGQILYPDYNLPPNENLLRGIDQEAPNLAQLCRRMKMQYLASPLMISEIDMRDGCTADGWIQVPPLITAKEKEEFQKEFAHHECFLKVRFEWPTWTVVTAEAKCHMHDVHDYPDLMYIVQVAKQMRLANTQQGILTAYYVSGKTKAWLIHRRQAFDDFVLERSARSRDHGYAGLLLDYDSYPDTLRNDAHMLQWKMEKGFQSYQFDCCPDTIFFSNQEAVEKDRRYNKGYYVFPQIDLLYVGQEDPIQTDYSLLLKQADPQI